MAKYEYPPGNCAGLFEVGMRFRDWADSQKKDWTYRNVMKDFGVCRATAYRWVAAWRDLNQLADNSRSSGDRHAA